jgi:hypothetical protein
MVTEKLRKRLQQITNFGMFPEVTMAPDGAVTFDKMVLVYLEPGPKRLYQVFFYNTEKDEMQRMG